MLAPGDDLRGDARTNFERLPGDAPEPFTPEALDGAVAIIDAVLGTGFSGEPREPARSAIEAINAGTPARGDGRSPATSRAASTPPPVRCSVRPSAPT